MYGPPMVDGLLAALALGSGGVCLRRLHGSGSASAPGSDCGGGHRADRESDGTEAVMGLGMAGMVLAPGALWGWLFAVFAGGLLLAASTGGSRTRRRHRLHHGIGALAMAYMGLAMSATGGRMPPMDGMTAAPAGLPLVTGVLLLYFGGYALWTGSRLMVVRAGGALPDACRVAMGIGMFAMLLTM